VTAWLAAWVPAAGQPEVSVDLPPPPEAGVGWLQPLAVVVLVLSVILVIRHRRRVRKHGITGLRSLALGAAVGNVLMDIGAILMPNRPAAVSVQELEAHVEEDAVGDGRGPPATSPRGAWRPGDGTPPGRTRGGEDRRADARGPRAR
jgi:hypothetical protein